MKMIVRMRRSGLMGLLCLFMAAVLVLLQAGGVRAWSGDSAVNTAICTASYDQDHAQITSDGSGGAIITWEDCRSGSTYDIYAQRVDSAGNVLWSGNGVAICTASYSQWAPQITSDGSGGAIITWYDQRSGGSNYGIYAQRVDSAGNVLWSGNGVAICTASGDKLNPQITSDGSAGAIITWQDGRSLSNFDIYAQRVDSAGNVLWSVNGVPICTASYDQALPQITSDGSAGAIITWQDGRSLGNYDIYARRVDSAGNVLWSDNGVAICTALGNQLNPQIISDGLGGAMITWQHSGPISVDIYAQRVDSSGAVQWTANGVAICTASFDQYLPQIISDGSGGVIITWEDYRSLSNNDIYAQRVDSSGAVQWTANGVAICTASGNQEDAQITSDGLGGAIITWVDYRSGSNFDIYARWVDSAGAIQWTADGVAICTASGDQYWAELISDGSGGAIITWQDVRNGSNFDIYAQRVDSSGNLADITPPTVTLTSTATSPTSSSPIPMTATFSEAVTGFVAGDITVVNGAASNFAGSGIVYTFNVTPSAQGAVTVNVAAAVAQDAAANGNTAATQYSITYDTVAPTVTLTSTATSPTSSSPIPMTATFSEAVTGFVVGDITVVNGAASNFAGSGTVYTFNVTPSAQGAVTVNVAAAVAQDAGSNGNTAATQYSITYSDTVAPTVTLTSTATSPTKTLPIPMTATFSEAVTGFAVGDIAVGNGAAGNFVAVSTIVYTFDVTPSGQGAVSVNVAPGVAQDAAANGNTAATQYNITYDSLPTITSFTTSSADEGYVVIITGTNFTGATAVKFGDKDALSFTVDSDTQISAVAGSGSSGKIAVTTAGGTATSADDFTPPASSTVEKAPSGGTPVWVWPVAALAVIAAGAGGFFLFFFLPRRKAKRS
jgi:hypothetical protein